MRYKDEYLEQIMHKIYFTKSKRIAEDSISEGIAYIRAQFDKKLPREKVDYYYGKIQEIQLFF